MHNFILHSSYIADTQTRSSVDNGKQKVKVNLQIGTGKKLSTVMHTSSYSIMVTIDQKWKRCGSCQGCLAKDCKTCKFCRDKKKYGGPGKLKQCCVKKKCTRCLQETNTKLPGIFKRPITSFPGRLLTAIHAMMKL